MLDRRWSHLLTPRAVARALDEWVDAAPARTDWVLRTAREMATQDWIVLGYLAFLVVAVSAAEPGPERTAVLERTVALFAFALGALALVRGRLLGHGWAAPIAQRLAVYGTIQATYFLLRDLLPLVRPDSVDARLYGLDMRLFGVEPAIAADRLVAPATAEWFAFFYIGYLVLLALHVLPFLVTRRVRLFAEFGLGLLLVYTIGQSLYLAVPGYGPVRFLASSFQHPLPRGFFVQATDAIVGAAGAQKDIFPSIHTAGPVFLTLFSFRHRREAPFRYTWPFVAFATFNIVLATMFLRWHYLVDVVAGLVLGAAAASVAASVARREVARRAARGLQEVWVPFPRRGDD